MLQLIIEYKKLDKKRIVIASIYQLDRKIKEGLRLNPISENNKYTDVIIAILYDLNATIRDVENNLTQKFVYKVPKKTRNMILRIEMQQ